MRPSERIEAFMMVGVAKSYTIPAFDLEEYEE